MSENEKKKKKKKKKEVLLTTLMALKNQTLRSQSLRIWKKIGQ